MAEIVAIVSEVLDKVVLEIGAATLDEAEADFYWHVQLNERFDFAHDPVVGAGSVDDDLLTLRAEQDVDDSLRVLSHEVEHLGGLIGIIGLILLKRSL